MTPFDLGDFLRRSKGGVSEEEGRALSRHAAECAGGAVVEIGSFQGKSSVALADGAARANTPVFCIEPHAPFTGVYGGVFGPQDRGAFYRTMLETGFFERVSLVNLKSRDAARAWKGPIGLLFVDGDHTERAVWSDIEAWEPHVSVGGVVALDDALDPRGGPSKVVARMISSGRFAALETSGKIVFLRKLEAAGSAAKLGAKRILVACHELVPAGGLFRFDRFGRIAQARGHELVYAQLATTPVQHRQVEFPVLSLAQAEEREWDVTMIPGAWFPAETIQLFARLVHPRFGLRMQHILNDRSRRESFMQVNAAFKPDVVVFNNRDWEPGSFTAFQARRFHVLEGGVDTNLLFPRRRGPSAASSRFVIGGLASKNTGPLLDAVRRLGPGIEVRLFGVERGDLKRMAADLIEAGTLRLLGVLTEAELPGFYRDLDCVVHTEEFAGWANLAAEALAAGVPLVCTRHGTAAFAVHEETALVVAEPSADEIASAVRRLREDDGLARRISERGRAVIGSYSWEAYTTELLKLAEEDDGTTHYTWAPELGLHGKWPPETRLAGLESVIERCAGRSVLDLGAAEGIIARRLLEKGAAAVHGVDRDPSRVARARAICNGYPGARFWTADLGDWKAFRASLEERGQAAYDMVLSLGLHQHLPREARLNCLLGAADLARNEFVMRTPAGLYEEDDINGRLASLGFALQGEQADAPDGAGIVRTYVRKRAVVTADGVRREFVSFPKSGRTWVRYALDLLGVADQIRFHHDGFEYNDGARPQLDFDFEKRLARFRNAGRLVYLHRDPRDVIVSLFYQVTGRFKDFFNYQGTLSDFIRDPYFGAPNLREFQRQWDELCARGLALRVTYEQCHRDFPAVLGSIMEHYGFSVGREELQRACDGASFDKMKEVEESGSFPHPWLKPRNEARKVRRGVAGGFREVLSAADVRFLDEVFDSKRA